jgi:recombination protein RecT
VIRIVIRSFCDKNVSLFYCLTNKFSKMSNVKNVGNNLPQIKGLFSKENVMKRFEDLMGKRSVGFISSVLQIVNDNKLLSNSDPVTVLNAAATAASLDLPINQNLGFAWIVPYKENSGRVVAQFQMGWRGYVQLAHRTGQYVRINVVTVYENQFKGWDDLYEELDCDFGLKGEGKVVGYAAYFRLKNGFEKTVFWTHEEVNTHGKKYSQSFNSSFGAWKKDFDGMGKKTVLKNSLSKWGVMSVDMIRAIEVDQSVQNEEGVFDYVDNEKMSIEENQVEEQRVRIIKAIEGVKNVKELKDLGIEDVLEGDGELIDLYEKKRDELLFEEEKIKEDEK